MCPVHFPAGCYWYEGKRNGRILSGNDETGPEMTKNNTAWLINGLNLTQQGSAKYVSTGNQLEQMLAKSDTHDQATKNSMTDCGETWQIYKVDKG